MSRITLIADSDFSIKVEGSSGVGEIHYEKGDIVHLEQDEKENLFISYHEVNSVKNDKNELVEAVVAFELDITCKDVLNSILENVLIQEEEMEDNIDQEEVSLDQLVIDEGMDLEEVCNYLTETSYSNRRLVRKQRQRVIRGGKVTTLLPVNRRKRRLTPKQRAAALKKVRSIARNPSAKKARVRAVLKRNRLNLKRQVSSVGYLIRKDRMLNESLHEIANRVAFILEKSLKENSIKVRLMENGTIKLQLEDKSQLSKVKEALKSCEVNFKLEPLSDMNEEIQIVSFYKPVSEQIISPFFSDEDIEERGRDKDRMPGEDEDDDELDDGNGEHKDKRSQKKD